MIERLFYEYPSHIAYKAVYERKNNDIKSIFKIKSNLEKDTVIELVYSNNTRSSIDKDIKKIEKNKVNLNKQYTKIKIFEWQILNKNTFFKDLPSNKIEKKVKSLKSNINKIKQKIALYFINEKDDAAKLYRSIVTKDVDNKLKINILMYANECVGREKIILDSCKEIFSV